MIDDVTTEPPAGGDPRPAPSLTAESSFAGRPAVARVRGGRDLWLIVGFPVLLGLLVLLYLGAHRRSLQPDHRASSTASSGEIGAPAPPADIANFESASRAGNLPQPAASPLVLSPNFPTPTPAAAVQMTPGGALLAENAANDARLKAPAMVVDLASTPTGSGAGSSLNGGSAASSTSAGGGIPKPAAGAGASGGATSLNNDEQFAERVGSEEPEHAQATMLRNLADTVPQGSMIPGVLETALDSDLPGYARAVVSREVRGFDGTTVLIPRGSRVIGQYKSAVAQGQSRAFVIWTRILRPDGASIQIGSSGTDPLGRAGLAGTVNRHFFEQFGSSVLLSVINAGITSLVSQPSTEVVIGSAQQATSLAGSSLLPTAIPPTIKVPQGTPIRIFVARDLDFSTAGGVGP